MKTISLDEAFDQRKNSLNFIRLFLAVIVVFYHSYALGGYGKDPIEIFFQLNCGEFAVNSFFAISGFLITSSFVNSSSLWQYLWKRILRILPGFWICLFFTAIVLCPIIYLVKHENFDQIKNIISNPFVNYIKANFFLKNNQPGIADLFINNPAPVVVNGSIWTLLPEFLCYLIIGFLGKLKLLNYPRKIFILFCILLIFFLLKNEIISQNTIPLIQNHKIYILRVLGCFTYFISGTLFYLYKKNIYFSTHHYLGSIFIFILCILLKISSIIEPIILPYILLGLAIKLPFNNFNRYGDYSYGIYIYSYPMQQAIYFFNQNIPNAIVFFIVSIVTTFPLAWLSWNLVEKPCLSLKKIKLSPRNLSPMNK